MIEEPRTLAELRKHLAEAEGRAILNGLPHVDGAEVDCLVCRRGLKETAEIAWMKRRDGLLWDVSVGHLDCTNGTG
jgi:hypothetical protein